MNFSDALHLLKSGHRVHRTGWNGVGMYLELQVPDEHSKMTVPYIYITDPSGGRSPWTPSQTDLLSDNWKVTGESN